MPFENLNEMKIENEIIFDENWEDQIDWICLPE